MGDISKNASPKSRIVVLFEIFLRKFWHLVKLNMLFLVFNLPVVLIMLFISQLFLPEFYFAMGAILLCIPVLTVGPAQAGFTYVLRNFAREEHAFLWEDFKEHALGNARQSFIICFIDLIVVLIVAFDINFYLGMGRGNILLSAISFLIMFLFLIYIMMHMYIYPMLVTFKLSVKQTYKNAFIFSIIKFFPNLGMLTLCFVLIMVPLLLFPVVGVLLFCFITMSMIGLITNFYVNPILKKYILDKLPGN